MTLRCHLSEEIVLERTTTQVAVDDPSGGWTAAGVAVLCPAETTAVVLTLSRDEGTPVSFRNIEVHRFEPGRP